MLFPESAKMKIDQLRTYTHTTDATASVRTKNDIFYKVNHLTINMPCYIIA